MPKFIIRYDYGFGEQAEVVEVATHEIAMNMAYEACKENAEMQMCYSAENYDKETAEELGAE